MTSDSSPDVGTGPPDADVADPSVATMPPGPHGAYGEALFRKVVEYAPSGLLMVDGEGRVVLSNAAVETMFGYSRDELLGTPVERLMPAAHRGAHAGLRRAFHANSTRRMMGAGRDLYALRRDGTEFPVEIGLMPVATAEGQWVLSAVVDLTTRKAQQALLEKALTEKTVLLNEVHHRVKNNLQVVSSLLNLQAQHATTEVRAALETSQARLRAMGLIHQLLYESRDYRQVPLAEYLRRLCGLLRDVHGTARQAVNILFRGTDPTIALDLARSVPCGLIVTELVTNAWKHAFPGGRRGTIAVDLDAFDGGVRLTVSDDGVGMPAGFRMDGTRSLGYQLIPVLVEQLHGRIAFAPGQGTRVEVEIPRQAEEHEP